MPRQLIRWGSLPSHPSRVRSSTKPRSRFSLLPQLTDLSLHFDVFGNDDDPPLLLLHGLGSSGEDWRAVAPRLLGFRVVVPDFRGHGRSDKPAGAYGVPLFANDIAAFCDAQGITHAHVVGLSMGGMIAFQLAVDRPDLVKSLVILNSGPALVPKGLAQWAMIAVRFVLTIVFGPKRLAPIVAKKLFPLDEQQALRDEITTRIAANDPSAYRRASTGILGWSVKDRLSSVTVPVLALSGDRDYTPVDDKRAWVKLLPNARLEVIESSGHGTPADQPAALTAAILRFVHGIDGGVDASVSSTV